MMIENPEVQSDDIIYNKTEVANHNFCKPHHSDNDTFWRAFQLSQTKKEAVQPFPQKASHELSLTNVTNAASIKLNNSQELNLFIIKSQTKTGAKRIVRLNKIRTLDPISTESDPTRSESFFSQQPRCQTTVHSQRKKVEFELPSESKWVFNTQLLRKVPHDEIEMKQLKNLEGLGSQQIPIQKNNSSSNGNPFVDSKPKVNTTNIQIKRTRTISANLNHKHPEVFAVQADHNRSNTTLVNSLTKNFSRFIRNQHTITNTAKPPRPLSKLVNTASRVSNDSCLSACDFLSSINEKTSKEIEPNRGERRLPYLALPASNNTSTPKQYFTEGSEKPTFRKIVIPKRKYMRSIVCRTTNESNITVIDSGSKIDFSTNDYLNNDQSSATLNSVLQNTNPVLKSERKKSSLFNKAQTNLLKKLFSFN